MSRLSSNGIVVKSGPCPGYGVGVSVVRDTDGLSIMTVKLFERSITGTSDVLPYGDELGWH